jgi:hypothetical protein
MPEVFISHSTSDHATAKELQLHLESKGASTFLASTTLAPGVKWSSEILARLRESKVVLFLASKAACDSKFVNQEIGGTILMQKTLVPILAGVAPEELPGWSKDYQAVEFKEDRVSVRKALDAIAERLRLDRLFALIFGAALLWLLIWLITRKG